MRNNIALDKKELKFQIQSHPSYPSLHAITGVLDHFNIDNVALDVPIDEATLTQLPKCFLARVKVEHKETFAVVMNKGLDYEIILNSKKKSKLHFTEFLDIFTGIIVAVEKTDTTIEQKNNNAVITNTLNYSAIVTVLSLLLFAKPNVVTALFLATSIIGVIISINLKKQEQGLQTVLGNAFCSGESKVRDCDAVLTSKGANTFGVYTLSDISLIYFSGLTLSVFALTLLGLKLSLPFAISLLAFPITLYSIYYQAFVVKKWCLLCLTIVVILWAHVTISAISYESFTPFSEPINSLLITVFSFISVLTIWNVLAPQVMSIQELKKIKIDHFKFKRNFNLFNTLLEQEKPIATAINSASEIVVGNPHSKIEITIVTSPFCGHCKPVHTLIEEILKKHAEQVKIVIRFNANTSNSDNNLVKVASRLVEIYNNKGQESCLTAMHHIYSGQDLEDWLTTFGVCTDTVEPFKVLEQVNNWCTNNSLNFTPVILINGNTFPKAYEREDLLYFLEELYENFDVEAIKDLELIT